MVISLIDATSHRTDDLARLDQQRWLVVAEEREMARDLHDGVGQVLGYASTQAQAARYLHGGQYQMADAALAHLTTVVQDAQTDLRNFVLGAQFGETLPGDFVDAVTDYVSRFEKLYDQSVRLTIDATMHDNWLATDAQTQLLHVIQEALTNARKHAQATTIDVLCRVTDNLVEVTISDNGIGFDPELIDAASHFGLDVMRSRMEEVGGVLLVQSTVGGGARISAKLMGPPVQPTADDLLSRLRIVIADDQPLFRDGLHNLLAARGIAVIGLAADGAEAVQRTIELQPDVVIMDIHMPVLDGLEATEQIKRAQPAAKVLILTVVENEATLVDALRRGASGYLLKTLDAQTLFVMLEQLARGETVLTPTMATHLVGTFMASDELDLSVRHQEILRLMAQGYTYRQIAAKIHLSESAVKYNAGQIIDRLHARTRAEAVRLAEKRGII
ncbi:MAG: response regulator [Anaerolineales bacterium]|nr:response regulator [Anaerolineales bacterium]